MKKVILDCDTGSDDCFAIALGLLNDNIELIGITVCKGNNSVDQCVDNTLKVVQLCGKKTPVYRGCSGPMLLNYDMRKEYHKDNIIWYYKEDGTKVCLHPESYDLPLDLKVQPEHACTYLVNTLMNTKEKITIVCVGPATNIGVALAMEPRIVDNIEEIVYMGGSVGMGNVTKTAEANFYNDPEAIRIALHSSVNIRLAPLNATHSVEFDDEVIERLDNTNKLGKFLAEQIRIRADVSKHLWNNTSGYVIHDGLAMAMVIDSSVTPDIRRQKCEIDTSPTRMSGTLTVEDDETSKVQISYKGDREKYINLILDAIHKLD